MSKAWMPLYIGDYLRKTRPVLSTLQHGAYLLLIMHYWDHGPLPNDDRELAKITGLSRYQWEKNKLKIFPYFFLKLSDNTLHHKRIDCELEKAETAYLKRALAGQKGGLHKRGQTNITRLQVEAMRKQSQSHASISYLEIAQRARKRASDDE